jgi:hypothetical protein
LFFADKTKRRMESLRRFCVKMSAVFSVVRAGVIGGGDDDD